MDYSRAQVTITGTFTGHKTGRANYGPIGYVNDVPFDLMVEPMSGGLPATFAASINDLGFPYLSLKVPTATCDPYYCDVKMSTAECMHPCTYTIVDMAHFDFTFVRSGTNEPMPSFGDFDLTFYDIDGSHTSNGILKEIIAVDGASWSEFSKQTTVTHGNFLDGGYFAEASTSDMYPNPTQSPQTPGAAALRHSTTFHMTGGNYFKVRLGGISSYPSPTNRLFYFSNYALDYGNVCPPSPPLPSPPPPHPSPPPPSPPPLPPPSPGPLAPPPSPVPLSPPSPLAPPPQAPPPPPTPCNASELEITLNVEGGLRLAGGMGGIPTLGVRGQFVKGGTSWINLQTVEEWQPLPVLMVPKLDGTMIVHNNGTTLIDVTAATDKWEVIPGWLEWRDVLVEVKFAPFDISAPNVSVPDFVAKADGGLQVLGEEGFYCTIQGELDTANKEATLSFQHAGGWSPFSGKMGEIFATPAFWGVAKFGVDNVCFDLVAVAEFDSFEFVPLLIWFVPHPLRNTSAEDVRGIELGIAIDSYTCEDGYNSTFSFSAGIKLGDWDGSPPPMGVIGTLTSDGSFELEAQTYEPWYPLPNLVPELVMSSVSGKASYVNATGKLKLWVQSDPLAHCPVVFFDEVYFLEFFNSTIVADVEPFVPWEVSSTKIPHVKGSLFTIANIGGEGGFDATLNGTFDSAARTATLYLSHSGGWSPLPGGFMDWFRTPQFDGKIAFNVSNVYLDVWASTTFLEPIDLIPGVLKISGTAGVDYNRLHMGPSLAISMIKRTEHSGDHPEASRPEFVAEFSAAFHIGSGDDAPPPVHAIGRVDSCGESSLFLQTRRSWAPLPEFLPRLIVPPLMGGVHLYPNGAIATWASHAPLEPIELGDLFSLKGLQINLTLAIGDVAAGKAAPRQCSKPAPKAGEQGPPPPPPSPPRSFNLTANMTGSLTLFDTDALSFDIKSSVQFETKRAELWIDHPGGALPQL